MHYCLPACLWGHEACLLNAFLLNVSNKNKTESKSTRLLKEPWFPPTTGYVFVRLKLGVGNLYILQHGTTLHSPAELYLYVPLKFSSSEKRAVFLLQWEGRTAGLEREGQSEGKEAGREGAVTRPAAFFTRHRRVDECIFQVMGMFY